MPVFPRHVPGSLVGIADPIIDVLGPLVPPADAQRARAALSRIDVLSAVSLGLEVVLPPFAPACDVSVLMPARRIPSFAEGCHESLTLLAESGGEDQSIWWELDTSSDDPAIGAFVRSTGTDATPLARRAAASRPDLEQAVNALVDVVTPYWQGEGRLIGFFPDRQPLPVAAALLPSFGLDAHAALRDLAPVVTASVDPDAALISHLSGYLDAIALAVGADAEGRTAVSWEGSFREREIAMSQDRWAPALQPSPVWGEAGESLASLLAVQGVHTFNSLPTIRLLSGIDHLKIGPGGRVKAYVGAHIVSPSYR